MIQPNCSHFIGKDSEKIKKYRDLKKKFDALRCEDYRKALDFWYENIDKFCTVIYLLEVLPNEQRPDLKPGDKNLLSCRPSNEDENQIFCKWFAEIYLILFPKYNFELQSERIEEKLIDNDNPKGFLELELERTKEHIDFQILGKPKTDEFGRVLKLSSALIGNVQLYYKEGTALNYKTATCEDVMAKCEATFYLKFKEFLENKLEELKSGKKSTKRAFEKMKWTLKLNKLATIFFELNKLGYIQTNPANLKKFLIDSFTDNNGMKLSEDTFDTYLKPDRNESRSKKGMNEINQLISSLDKKYPRG